MFLVLPTHHKQLHLLVVAVDFEMLMSMEKKVLETFLNSKKKV